MKLFYRAYGRGRPLIILHGLFGASDNWGTMAKMLSQQFHVLTIDQRNHGQSPHNDEHNYQALSKDLYTFIMEHELQKPILLGHSMGGKTVMNFAIKYPDIPDRLIIVDIAPKPYPALHNDILKGLQSIPIERIASRKEADQILSQYITDPATRQFLLKNLTHNQHRQFTWKINISALNKHIDEIGKGLEYSGQFEGLTLFIKGTKSHYITDEDEKIIKKKFPNACLVSLNAGHWVHAEQPRQFANAIFEFLQSQG